MGSLEGSDPETGLSGRTGSETLYTIDVPAGATNLTFNLSDGSGDADLYVRFGSQPSTETYECRSINGKNDESCSFESPQTGTYHVLVHAFRAYSGVSLVASYTETSIGVELINGVAESGLSGETSSETFYIIDVPEGARDLTFNLSDGTGDADLYVRFGSPPSITTYDCLSINGNNNESCSLESPQSGIYHVLVYAYRAYSGASLVASYTDPGDGVELTNGVAESDLSSETGSEVFFTIDVPEGATDLTFNLSGGSGDADLYVRFGSQPSTTTYDCRSIRGNNNESCSFESPRTGTYHVQVYAFRTYSEASLVARYTEPSCGASGSARNLSAAEDQRLRYRFDVDACATTVTVTLSGRRGDADLYVRFGAPATMSTYDCRSLNSGNRDSCTITPAQAGRYHILVYAFSTFSGVTLEASYE